MLYYFDSVQQLQVLGDICESTHPGGYFIASVTEPLQTLGKGWPQEAVGVYEKL